MSDKPVQHIRKKWYFEILVIVLLSLITICSQFLLLKSVYSNLGFATEWSLFLEYKFAGIDFLSKALNLWTTGGIYTTYMILYIGILKDLFGLKPDIYHTVNIILKTLATLSLYPLIFVIFRRRLLAVLTTLLYGISYSSAGPLAYTVKGSDYLAITFMNILFISYYYTIQNRNKRTWLLSSAFLFLLTFIFSPIRLFPLFLLLPLIELFLLWQMRFITTLRQSLQRLLLVFLPCLLLISFANRGSMNNAHVILTLTQQIINGNWYLILNPLSGLGYTFLNNQHWGYFGNLQLDNFGQYLSFLLTGPFLIFYLFSAVISFLISKKPLRFLFFVTIINFIVDILIYFISTHHKYIPLNVVISYNPYIFWISKYAALFGAYILIIAFGSLIVWRNSGKRNTLLLALFIGPAISCLFLFSTWVFLGAPFTFFEGTEWYLVIPAIGSCLFIGAVMNVSIDFAKKIKFLNYAIFAIIFMIFFSVYQSSQIVIESFYRTNNPLSPSETFVVQNKLFSKTENLDTNEHILYYFKVEDKSFQTKRLQAVLDPNYMAYWIFLKRGDIANDLLSDGCIGVIREEEDLRMLWTTLNGESFIYKGTCVNGVNMDHKDNVFYKVSNFHAFKIREGELVNLTQEILVDLQNNTKKELQ